MTIDLRDFDTREHAPRHGLLPDGKTPLEEPDKALTKRIDDALDLIRAQRALERCAKDVVARKRARESGQGEQ